jgi:hypothetical protein
MLSFDDTDRTLFLELVSLYKHYHHGGPRPHYVPRSAVDKAAFVAWWCALHLTDAERQAIRDYAAP